MRSIYETERDRHCRAFFRPEFISQRLGKPGSWQGSAIDRLGLRNPIQAEDLATLLQGRTREGERLVRDPLSETNPVTGWRFNLTAEAPVSVLWALAPPVVSARIRLAHNEAVQAAVTDFERTLNRRPWYATSQVPERQRTLFAKFSSGASRQQTPRLETSLVLCNFIIQRGNGGLSSFTQEEVNRRERRLQSVYKRTLETRVSWIVGGKIHIPNELCQRFLSRSDAGPAKTNSMDGSRPLRGQQLFEAWQEQARGWGWGPMKVAALLRDAQEQTNVRNMVRDYGTVARLGRLWIHQRVQAAKGDAEQPEKAPQAKQPEPAKKVERDQGMTHSY